MEQERLFRLAHEAINIAAVFEPGRGWFVRIGMRRQDEPWAEAHQSVYELLQANELCDVICGELEVQLGL